MRLLNKLFRKGNRAPPVPPRSTQPPPVQPITPQELLSMLLADLGQNLGCPDGCIFCDNPHLFNDGDDDGNWLFAYNPMCAD